MCAILHYSGAALVRDSNNCHKISLYWLHTEMMLGDGFGMCTTE